MRDRILRTFVLIAILLTSGALPAVVDRASADAVTQQPAVAGGAGLQHANQRADAAVRSAIRPRQAELVPIWEDARPRPVAVWSFVLALTALGAAAGVYPIAFYIRRVWRWRQQTIFSTLSADAKRLYLVTYHKDAAVDLQNAEERFRAFYDDWFGRDRLIAPAVLVALFVTMYVFAAILSAAKAMGPPIADCIPFAFPLTALGAMTGAYILVSLDAIGRVARRDLLPDDLYLAVLRLAAAVPFGYAFASLVKPSVAPFVALALAALPLVQTAELLRTLVGRQLRADVKPEITVDALSRLSGIDRTICDRLSTIGVNTVTQLAYSDPIQLTMRTSLSFTFVLDIVSEALAWIYLEDRLDLLRPMALRGSFELAVLALEYRDKENEGHLRAVTLMSEIPAVIKLSGAQFENALHQIVDDPLTGFLLVAYPSQSAGVLPIRRFHHRVARL